MQYNALDECVLAKWDETIIPTLQTKKLRFKEMRVPVQGSMTYKWPSQDSNLVLLAVEAVRGCRQEDLHKAPAPLQPGKEAEHSASSRALSLLPLRVGKSPGGGVLQEDQVCDSAGSHDECAELERDLSQQAPPPLQRGLRLRWPNESHMFGSQWRALLGARRKIRSGGSARP